jgi:hypothetical protein
VNTFTDYLWKLTIEYEIFAYQGNNPEEKVHLPLWATGRSLFQLVLKSRVGNMQLVTNHDAAPKPKDSVVITSDVNISWLLNHLSSTRDLYFSIDRTKTSCRTPRRNEDVKKALSFFTNFYSWAGEVSYQGDLC